MRRLRAIVLTPFLALDCLGNAIFCDGSLRHTMSGEAWRHRDHPNWGWTHHFIDGMFFWDPDHCADAAATEAMHGSIWAAWWADIKG